MKNKTRFLRRRVKEEKDLDKLAEKLDRLPENQPSGPQEFLREYLLDTSSQRFPNADVVDATQNSITINPLILNLGSYGRWYLDGKIEFDGDDFYVGDSLLFKMQREYSFSSMVIAGYLNRNGGYNVRFNLATGKGYRDNGEKFIMTLDGEMCRA
ncbi:hypothetical protein [Herbaspirillum sp.]|uniref:hypothetical protein n=1 Tax=Herbaspirillum sp. TaxID=1890675 RepID=UPI000C09B225|nr:hypothetical protein [Herbaspirillum sp.]MAF04411.1 hypothetical protein [Herbaspirillum sp.]|tara:strand:- start:34088 stop:34552 length:465 start_codon:yes stop_codon:yes gene_type:complete